MRFSFRQHLTKPFPALLYLSGALTALAFAASARTVSTAQADITMETGYLVFRVVNGWIPPRFVAQEIVISDFCNMGARGRSLGIVSNHETQPVSLQYEQAVPAGSVISLSVASASAEMVIHLPEKKGCPLADRDEGELADFWLVAPEAGAEIYWQDSMITSPSPPELGLWYSENLSVAYRQLLIGPNGVELPSLIIDRLAFERDLSEESREAILENAGAIMSEISSGNISFPDYPDKSYKIGPSDPLILQFDKAFVQTLHIMASGISIRAKADFSVIESGINVDVLLGGNDATRRNLMPSVLDRILEDKLFTYASSAVLFIIAVLAFLGISQDENRPTRDSDEGEDDGPEQVSE